MAAFCAVFGCGAACGGDYLGGFGATIGARALREWMVGPFLEKWVFEQSLYYSVRPRTRRCLAQESAGPIWMRRSKLRLAEAAERSAVLTEERGMNLARQAFTFRMVCRLQILY